MNVLFGLIALGAQADAAPIAPPAPVAPPHNFLKKEDPVQHCAARSGNGEIVVCGRAEADEGFRLRPLADASRYDPKKMRAETKVFGDGTLSVHGATRDVGGFTSKRAMVTLAVPF